MSEPRSAERDAEELPCVDCAEESALPHLELDRERPLLAVLAGIQFAHIVDFMIMMPLGPQFMTLFHIGPHQFSLLVSSYTLSAGTAGLIAALFVDRFDRRHALLSLYTGFIVATFACGLAPGYAWLLAARAAAGAFGGLLGASVLAIVGDVIPESRRGAAMGTVMSAFSLAAVAGVPTGLVLANAFGWRAPFLSLSAVSLVILALARRHVPRLRHHVRHAQGRSALAQLAAVLGHRNHLRAFALVAVLTVSAFAVIPFISPYLVSNTGLTLDELPLVYLSGGLMTLFTARLIGRLADRHGKRRVFIAIALLSLIPILLITHLPVAPLAVTITVTTLFMVLVSGRFVPAMALITASVEPRLRGSFMSVHASVQQFASAFATLGAGLVITRGADGALTHYGSVGWAAALATVTAVLIARTLRRAPRARP
ncbi:MAG TPA: MFS transporter [Burkholderiales bacterium]|nr:MFS transporter [Burkholderiales bacterium]